MTWLPFQGVHSGRRVEQTAEDRGTQVGRTQVRAATQGDVRPSRPRRDGIGASHPLPLLPPSKRGAGKGSQQVGFTGDEVCATNTQCGLCRVNAARDSP